MQSIKQIHNAIELEKGINNSINVEDIELNQNDSCPIKCLENIDNGALVRKNINVHINIVLIVLNIGIIYVHYVELIRK